jgi:L-aminopeptidase/D-esterase-like protein
MSAAPGASIPLPAGFAVGHWSNSKAQTGCTVVISPPSTRAGVDVRGGGPGTRETEILSPTANAEEANAVVLSGGSAFGLAAADGVTRWLEEHGRGYATTAGLVPIVPAAVIYDLRRGRADVRPGPEEGYAACEAAREGIPRRGRLGAGSGAAVAKLDGPGGASPGGVGYAALRLGTGETVAAVTVVNAAGDVLAEDGSLIAGPRDASGAMSRSSARIPAMEGPPAWTKTDAPEGSTTLVCVCTDATLTKPACGAVARMASAGIARAVDPVFSPVDGDVVFCLASGRDEMRSWAVMVVGSAAATVTAAAIRDAVRQAAEG